MGMAQNGIGSGWTPVSWRQKPIVQVPEYPDPEHLATVEAQLAKLPPLVFPEEARQLQSALAMVESGDAFLFQAGDCAEAFAETCAETARDFFGIFQRSAAILAFGSALPVIQVGRIAGEYAKPRSSPTETVNGIELPSYRGDMINAFNFTPEGRRPDPDRQIAAYRHAASTLNLLRSFSNGESPGIENIGNWMADAAKPGALFQHRRGVIDGMVDALRFMRAWDGGSERHRHSPQIDFYVSHEGLLLGYEQALTRMDWLSGDWYAGSAHLLWIGDRSRQPDHAHVEYFRGIKNPIGIKCGPTLVPEELVRLLEILDPDHEPGRITLICRMGAGQVANKLPPLIRQVRQAGRSVIWCCDPMHGNTVKTESGVKTRVFDDIVVEVEAFFGIHAAEGTYPGGLHLEMTPQDVTECMGGTPNIREADLARRYQTYCDPRLNGSQTVELSFIVADLLRTRRLQQGIEKSVFQVVPATAAGATGGSAFR